MYCILDIETTGGQFNEEGITEIAIYKFDGHEVVDQFISLVNPEKEIQPFVVKLTGINNTMLRNAPKFYEIAKRIIEITTDCVLVAHNASFDYRILRTEFRRLGYDFQIPNLCTVELSQKLMPEQPSHSLGKLVRALGIPIVDRHRANGDALATVKLFKILLEKDHEKTLLNSLIKLDIEKKLEPKLYDILENLPSRTGVYYIYNTNGQLIFIGKSRNIKKRVRQHFTEENLKSKKIQAEVYNITYEETGSELISILKEMEEIAVNKPKYNIIPRIKKTIIALKEIEELDLSNAILVDKGRKSGEKSVLLIENKTILGYAYCDLNFQILNAQILKNLINPLQNNKRNWNSILNHIAKNKHLKIIHFE